MTRKSKAASGRGAQARRAGSVAPRGAATVAESPAGAMRLARWLVVATLVVPPFVLFPPATDAFRPPQRLVAEGLALASLVPLALAGRWPAARELWRRAALRALLPLLVVALAGLAVTAHPAHLRDALADLGIGAVALAGWSLGLPRPTLRRLLDAILVPALALAFVAILQIHHLWEPLRFVKLNDERLGITSFTGNPGDLAAFLVLPCLVAQAGLVTATRAGRWWRGVVLGASLYALAGSQTLTSLVAVVVGSAVLWGSLLPRRRLLAFGAAAAVVGSLLIAAVPPLRGRAAAMVVASREGDLNFIVSGRLDAWRVAARLLREHPAAGVGLGAFPAEFSAAALQLQGEGSSFFAGHVRPTFSNAHSEYLQVAAELGWPGLVALAWAAAVTVGIAWRAATRRSPADRALCWSGVLSLALLALSYFPMHLGPVAFGWLGWLAWVLADGGVEEEGRPAPRYAARLVAGLLLLALLGQAARGWHRLQAAALADLVRREMIALGGARPPGPLQRASEAALERAHRLDPAAIEPLAYEADLLLVAGRLADAEAAYRRAAAHELRPEVLFNWGLALWQQGRTEEAVVQLRRAVALAPRFAAGLPPGSRAAVAAAPLRPVPPLQPSRRAGTARQPN